MKKFISRLIAFVLFLSMLQASACAEIQDNEIAKYSAITVSRLKLRLSDSDSSRAIDSIPEGTRLEIIELGNKFFKVKYRNIIGYVDASHFRDFKINSIKLENIIGEYNNLDIEKKPSEIQVSQDDFNMSEGFVPRYIAKPSDTLLLYKAPDEKSGSLTVIPRYSFDLVMSQIKGDWAMAKFNDKVGFIKTKSLVQYDFVDPYADPFPGITHYEYAALLPQDTVIYDQKNLNKHHKTIPGGAILALEDSDEIGYAHVAYMKRKQALVKKEDIFAINKVVDYRQAQKGDLISVFSTFYPVHNTNLHIIGRIYNMALAGDMLSGIILKPNEELSMNDIMGPYKKNKGYMEAPIASKVANYGYGGGTCQVNTTMYNTLIQVPILVKHRRVHSRSGAVYVPVGFDAAVGSLSTINMIFKNTLNYPIMFRYAISDNVLTCLIYRAD